MHTPVRGILTFAALLSVAALLASLFFDVELATWLNREAKELRRSDEVVALKVLGKFAVPIWLVLLLAWIRGDRRMIPTLLAAMVITGVSVPLLKLATGIPRPDRGSVEGLVQPREIEDFQDLSFPSGDSAYVVALAVIAAAFLRKPWQRFVPYALSAAVAVLRVVSARHWASDALAGAALGLLAGLLAPMDRAVMGGLGELWPERPLSAEVAVIEIEGRGAGAQGKRRRPGDGSGADRRRLCADRPDAGRSRRDLG